MVVFDTKQLNPGAWFTYDNDPKIKESDRAKVRIRPLSEETLSELLEKHVQEKVEYRKKNKRGELQRISYMDFTPEAKKAYKYDLWDYVIAEWTNFVDADGKEIKCTRANKILLMSGSPDLYEFVNRCTEKLTEDEAEVAKAREKN